VTPAKQRKLRRLGAQWLSTANRRSTRGYAVRFDVAAVHVRPGEGYDIEIIKAAF
jgi:Holliday junction resolvase-like predicted endonuclease